MSQHRIVGKGVAGLPFLISVGALILQCKFNMKLGIFLESRASNRRKCRRKCFGVFWKKLVAVLVPDDEPENLDK